ncbi:hypothetical protein EDB86DRAFT_2816559, partial [Lactarius hatsudake]
WRYSNLDLYDIQIHTVHMQEFFGIPHLPAPAVDPILLDHVSTPVGLHLPWEVRLFFHYLAANACIDADQALVLDFVYHLLGTLLHLDEPDHVINQRPDLHFVMGGQLVRAEPDFALQDPENRTILLIQQDKGLLSQDQAEPQLVAEALAAFHTDNSSCIAMGLPPSPSRRYLGIVMVGVAPCFYKITITQALADAVMHSQFPTVETIVQHFIPPVSTDLATFLRQGMLPLDNRRICFQCFEALRTLL